MPVAHAELMSVGPDEMVVTFTSDPGEAVSTRVGYAEVTTVGPFHTARIAGLEPDTAVLAIGAPTGEPFAVSPWERRYFPDD